MKYALYAFILTLLEYRCSKKAQLYLIVMDHSQTNFRYVSQLGTIIVSLFLTTFSVASDFSFEIGADVKQFNYQEFDDDNVILDEEHGTLPGVALGLEWQWPSWFLSVDSSMLSGTVDYSGFTQSSNPSLDGIPVNTTTDTFIIDSLLTSGYRFGSDKRNYSSLYAGLGYHFWYRGIRDGSDVQGNPVSGLDEYYSWIYAALGGKWAMLNTQRVGGSVNLQARHNLAGQMSLTLPGRDQMDFTLGNDWSMRLSVPFQYYISKQSSLTLQPYYETWNLGKSDIVEETINGAPTGNAYLEPRSETRNFGIWFTFDKQY